ncbi:MAG: hypothetical protein ACQERB_05990 [Promethearchaeati archaeon]
MEKEVENRLHRVKIALNTNNIRCPYSNSCSKKSEGGRCNIYYKKCSLFKEKD